MTRANYIFIDYENVREFDLERIANRPVKVTLILGEQHTKLAVQLVKQLMKFAAQVDLFETGCKGRNALDLVLATKLGAQRQSDPQGYFHILSGDKDFDALIAHLKERGVFAARHKSFSEIRVLMNLDERAALLKQFFAKKEASRPKTVPKLETSIQATFARVLSAEELADTIAEMVKRKIISIDGKRGVDFL